MPRPAALSVVLALVLALVGALVGVRASEGASPATAYFLVRPDLRLCPSPLCGGAWVRRVNHKTTRCVDGSQRAECYVASAARVPDPLWSVQAGSVLARGRLVPAGIEGFPDVGALAATAVWRPGGKQVPRGTTFRVVDTGLRCVTTPCFSLTAVALEGGMGHRLSDLDISRVGVTTIDRARAERSLHTGGLLVTGTLRVVPDAGPAGAGRTLRATQLWLPLPRP